MAWMAVVIKPTDKESWVKVSCEQPLCQVIGLPKPISSLENISAKQVESDVSSVKEIGNKSYKWPLSAQ